jgi:iron complex outermembrane receptor protein
MSTCWVTVLSLVIGATSGQPTQELRRLSLEDLLNIRVTAVSRIPERRAVTPAAVYVLTQEEIRRSGATSLAAALRLVPGLHVARIDGNRWAVGIRGFTDRLARAMLVLIDGRPVYSPLFAGTFWEVQDTLLQDVDRIEIVRGPGGLLWGANAVTGIINIITKRPEETPGLFLAASGGMSDRGLLEARYGGARGEDFHYRLYAKALSRDGQFHPSGANFDEAWRAQAGGRAQWSLGGERTFTLQGDVYDSRMGQRTIVTSYTEPPFRQVVDRDNLLAGGNVVALWEGPTRAGGSFRLQTFYDRTRRDEPTFKETRHTGDLDLQHAFRAGRHDLVWGANYRVSAGAAATAGTLRFDPASRTDHLITAFIRDEITLAPDRWRVSFGTKVERNGYSGFEWQPSGRLIWTPSDAHTIVGSVARAVRTPSRVEQDFETGSLVAATPTFIRVSPNPDFVSEKTIAAELGYRLRLSSRAFLAVSSFFNRLDDVLSTELGAGFVETDPPPARVILPLVFGNTLHGQSYGLETNADVHFGTRARWTASYSFLRVELTKDPGSLDISQEFRGEGIAPRHMASMTWSIDLPRRWFVDWSLRYVSRLRALGVPAYATSDVRLGWMPRGDLELSIVGRNLHERRHLEFEAGAVGNSEIQRAVVVRIAWTK